MFVTEEQLKYIDVPKKNCQRGLEEYVVSSHPGDKQVTISKKPSYRYMNNPIYRVGVEGDPAPQALSSRLFGPRRQQQESILHTLYPAIDSGSINIPDKAWDQRWYYGRGNIPNVLESQERVDIDKNKMESYNQAVTKKITDQMIDNQVNRYIPVYDESRINDLEVPDGMSVRSFGNDKFSSFIDEDIPNNPNIPVLSPITTTFGEPKLAVDKNRVDILGKPKIENYIDVRPMPKPVSSNINNKYGHYGYPQPSGYASMGDHKHKYEVFPKTPVLEYFNNNKTNYNGWYFVGIITLFIIILLGVLYRKTKRTR